MVQHRFNVFISLIFSGMTGSAIADASGIGLMEIDQMKKEATTQSLAVPSQPLLQR